ncbi:hypothetical protein SAMN05216353_10991 [Halobacillus alkaliphilus]|uniref:Uncharacterized protein n=1 Tax=Halobacillus alkaliphilus TaxID=396056 RepID=A0A1I2LLC8_9BACI|nr:hypothetical protein [Halobacillus alkaliphilus]SFF80084.1 hypothetical protein SAMN05216353_10991 [Halobacillus alkaliphilus]
MTYMEKTNQVIMELKKEERAQFGNYSYSSAGFTDGKQDVPEWEVRQFVLKYFLILENSNKYQYK